MIVRAHSFSNRSFGSMGSVEDIGDFNLKFFLLFAKWLLIVLEAVLHTLAEVQTDRDLTVPMTLDRLLKY